MSSHEITGLARPLTLEIDRIKGSRFIGDAAPAGDDDAALSFVAAIREREPSATHHCWAFRLADGRERSSDDGEPGGTAGAPILRRIGGADLSDVVVVVTRYYGGTKLGTGGLVRAYGGCAGAVLDAAERMVRPRVAVFAVDHPYELSGPIEGVLAAHDATVLDADYGAAVSLRVQLPLALAEGFAAALQEATAGRVEARPAG